VSRTTSTTNAVHYPFPPLSFILLCCIILNTMLCWQLVLLYCFISHSLSNICW